MENASKALIIAGAILISILIIAIGVYIYNSAQEVVQGTNMNSEQIQMFNAKWTGYEGQMSGTQVKALINALMANVQENFEEMDKVPIATIQAANAQNNIINLTNTNDTGRNAYLNNANALYNAVQARHKYTVTITMDPTSSLVHNIFVAY